MSVTNIIDEGGLRKSIGEFNPSPSRMPKASFLVAAFNEEKYIRACVESCLMQDYGSVEVCVVDDGSTDRTWSELQYFADDARVKVARFEYNRGKVAAFNRAYELATGNYFLLLGADDTSPPNRARVSIAALGETGAALVYGDYWVCDEDLRPVALKKVASGITSAQLTFNNKIPGGVMCFPVRLARTVFPIPSDLPFEDWWIAFHAVLVGGLAKVDVPLVFYRQHPGNDSRSQNRGEPLKLKDFRRHDKYYLSLLRVAAKYGTNGDGLLTQLAKSQCFKRIYVAESLSERRRLWREARGEFRFSVNPLDCIILLLLMPGGRRLIDFIIKMRTGG